MENRTYHLLDNISWYKLGLTRTFKLFGGDRGCKYYI